MHADSRFKTLKDMVEASKADPGSVTLAGAGAGSSPHLGALAFQKAAGIKVTWVPMQGSANMRTAVLGQHVDGGVTTVSVSVPMQTEGQARVLGLMAEERWDEAPDVQTFAEQGYPAEWSASRGVAGPAGLPEDVKAKLVEAVKKTYEDPEFQALAKRDKQIIRYLGPDDFEKYARNQYNMLDEMRRVALLIFMDTLLGVDFRDDLPRLWRPILRLLKYISPGTWLIWRHAPRPGYRDAIRAVDDYLYGVIAHRRENPSGGQDLLSLLIASGWMDDDLIRDQLLTMLIAGHDTGTALLAWSLYLLGKHPQAMARARREVDQVLGASPPDFAALQQLDYLNRVVKESLRLYPPIHVGTRRAREELSLDGYRLPDRNRILYSIYLTHRDPQHWACPDDFDPDRFVVTRGARTHDPYAYVPFGGGPRNCIGAVFGQVEAQTVLARLLQTTNLVLVSDRVRPYMGATLEPHPGVFMTASPRSNRS